MLLETTETEINILFLFKWVDMKECWYGQKTNRDIKIPLFVVFDVQIKRKSLMFEISSLVQIKNLV